MRAKTKEAHRTWARTHRILRHVWSSNIWQASMVCWERVETLCLAILAIHAIPALTLCSRGLLRTKATVEYITLIIDVVNYLSEHPSFRRLLHSTHDAVLCFELPWTLRRMKRVCPCVCVGIQIRSRITERIGFETLCVLMNIADFVVYSASGLWIWKLDWNIGVCFGAVSCGMTKTDSVWMVRWWIKAVWNHTVHWYRVCGTSTFQQDLSSMGESLYV